MSFRDARLRRGQFAVGGERAVCVARALKGRREEEARARVRGPQRDRRAEGGDSARVVARAEARARERELRVEVFGREADGLLDRLERARVVAAHGDDDGEQGERVGCARLKLASAVAPSIARVGERRFDCAARERLGVCGAARVECGERGPVERLAVARSSLLGKPDLDAADKAIGGLDPTPFGRWVEINVEAVEAENRGAPPARSVYNEGPEVGSRVMTRRLDLFFLPPP